MKIYTADANNILIDKFVELALAKIQDKNNNVVLIVPEKFSLSVEKLLLVRSKRKALINVQVVTLSRLLKKLYVDDCRYISSSAGVMIVKKIILDNIDKLVCFKKTARTLGFAKEIYDTISEFKNSGVSPADFDKVTQNLGTSLKIKLEDVFLLYREYEKYLAKYSYRDACDRFSILGNLVKNSSYVKTSDIMVLGFDNISASGREVLEALAVSAKEITFAVIDNAGKFNSYICPPEMKLIVEEIAKDNNIPTTEIALPNTNNEVSVHIANNLFSYPYTKIQIGDEVEVFQAKNITKELEFVAEKIRKRVIEDKLRFNEIAIVCSDVEGYGNVAKTIFEDYDIPLFVDNPVVLTSHCLTNFVLNCLYCCSKNFFVSDILSVVKNYFSNIDQETQNVFENYCFKYGINYDKFKKPFVFGKEENGLPSPDFQLAETTRINIVSKLLQLLDAVNGSKRVAEYIKAVHSIFEMFDVDSGIEKLVSNLKTIKNFALAELTKQAKDKICAVLEEMDIFLGKEEMSFDEFCSIFVAGLENTKVSLIPVSIDNCILCDLSTAKLFGIKDLYVVGASEGNFPAVKEDCGIVVDKELGILSDSIGKKIEPTIRTINQREKYKVLQLLQNFAEKITISYSTYDRHNTEQKISSSVKDLQKIFYTQEGKDTLETLTDTHLSLRRGLLRNNERVASFAHEFATVRVGQRKLVEMVRDSLNNCFNGRPEVISSLYNTLEPRISPRVKNFLNGINEPKQEPTLSKSKDLFFNKNKTSISHLETYFSCPYKYFAKYGLKIREREDSRIKQVDVGNVLHKIAEEYVKHRKRIVVSSSEQTEKNKERLIEEVFKSEKLQSASNKHIVLQLKKEAKRLMSALEYQCSNSLFKTKGEELVFGEKGSIPALSLGNRISIEGKIDRVDTLVDPDPKSKNKVKFRVIDYKTGYINLSPNLVYYGKKIQLFVYLNALKNKDAIPVGAFYFPIKDDYINENEGNYFDTYRMQGYFEDNMETIRQFDTSLSFDNPHSKIIEVSLSTSAENVESGNFVISRKSERVLGRKTIDEITKYVHALSRQAVDEILSGYIADRPVENSGKIDCEHCELRFVCGKNPMDVNKVRKIESGIKFNNFAGGGSDE